MTGQPMRNRDLEITETEDGIVIYQPERDRVHTLNASASVILELCDGTRSVAEIALELAAVFGLDSVPTEETDRCIALLAAEGLLG
ncbi:MAG: PqqD family peptide modification chaperone [Acidimicrobiales bacterium]|jgi:hypothetical protein